MQLTRVQKAGIGACAGICLTLVTAVKAGFWLEGYDTLQTMLGILTCLALALISVIYTPFLEEDKPLKLFLQALVAPSFLLAVATQHGSGSLDGSPLPRDAVDPSAAIEDISDATPATIGWMPAVGPLVAASVLGQVDERDRKPEPLSATRRETLTLPVRVAGDPPPKKPETVDPRFKPQIITRGSFGDTPFQGIQAVFGGKSPSQRFIVTVGKTTDWRKAAKLAEQISRLEPFAEERVRVVQPKGKDEFYVVLGEFASAKWTVKKKKDHTRWAKRYLKRLGSDIDPEIRRVVGLLVKSKAIDARTLFQERPSPEQATAQQTQRRIP